MESPDTQVTEFYRALDNGEFDSAGKKLASEAELIFNSRPPVKGRDQILQLAQSLQQKVNSLIHDIERNTVDPEKQVVLSEQAVTYHFSDGDQITVQAANVMDFADEQITRWQIYADMREVDQKMEALAAG
ncbi:MAG: nuclear transport factor 2 family protein [Thermomicrobiales bacterium]